MGLAQHFKQWIDDPTTPGERVCFRKPSWTDREEAMAERRRHSMALARETRETVGKEIMDEWRAEAERAKELEAAKAAESTAVTKPPTAEEVLAEYDQLILLRAGIADWSYCEPRRDDHGDVLFDQAGNPVPDRSKPIRVTLEAIRDLEPDTAKWMGLTLVALAQSGYRPIMPDVVKDEAGTVIDVRPGDDPDPLPSPWRFTATSQVPPIATDALTDHRLSGSYRAS